MDVSQVFNKVLGRNEGWAENKPWENFERAGWLMKQGEFLKTWRRRWFVMKEGKLYWFKSDIIGPNTEPRGIIEINRCLSIKGAEDSINKPFAFEVSTNDSNMFLIAESEKEKEDWINAVGRAIVRHSKSMLDTETADYDGY